MPDFKVKLSDNEEERKFTIENLKTDIVQLKEMKRKRLQIKEDEDYAKKCAESAPAKSDESRPAHPIVPVPKGNPKVQEFRQNVLEMFNVNIEYSLAESIFLTSNNDMATAITNFETQTTARITFIHNEDLFEETFNLHQKGDVMIPKIYAGLKWPSSRKLELFKDQSKTQLLTIDLLRSKTLGELGIVDGNFLFVK